MCGGMLDFLRYPKCKGRFTSMQITHISFSGGGMSGLAYLGVIRYLQMERIDVGIQSLVGTSMGALFACVMALGIPAGTMEEDVKEFFSDEKNAFFEASGFMQMFHRLGINHASMLTKPLEKYLMKLWDTLDVTFLDFAKKTGKDLVICASCIETSKAMYFSVNTTPDVYVLKAIQASMAVPMVFFPVEIGGKHYIDGGVTDNHPVDCFGEQARNSMLAVKMAWKKQETVDVNDPTENVVTYLTHIMYMMFQYWDRQYQKAKYSIICDHPPVPFLPCKYSKEGISVKITNHDVDASIEYGFVKAYDMFEVKRASEQPPSEL